MTLSPTAQRYYPGAIQYPGPAGKVYAEANTVDGAILHSMQGSWAGAQTVLYDENVDTSNRYRAACWHFSILRSGEVYQHYPLDASPFHAGNGVDNRRLIGIEHEGGPPGNLSEPLTAAQTVSSVALVRWIALTAGWEALTRHTRLLEHNETTSTQCPSGRIDWSRYMDTFTQEDVITLFKYVVGGNGIAPGVTVTPQPRSPQNNRVFKIEMP